MNFTQSPKNEATATKEGALTSRRGFLGLLTGSAVSFMVGGFSMDAKAEKSTKELNIEKNRENMKALIELMKSKGKPVIMENSLGGKDKHGKKINEQIYNDYNELLADYNEGKFLENKGKYYKPTSFQNKVDAGGETGILKNGFRKGVTTADLVIVAEIQGTNDSEQIITKGWAVIKSGTEYYTKTENGTEMNYLAECYNAVYGYFPLCPPCD